MADKKPGVGVGVYIFKNGKLLLGKRQSASTHGVGVWCPPGGKLDFGESFIECAKREVAEECGIKTSEPIYMSCTNDVFEKDGMHFVTIAMRAEWISGEPQVLEPHKIAKWQWFDLDDLPTPLFAPVANFFNNGLELLRQ